MNNITELNSQNFIDAETMKKIREHANLYDRAYDKKEFLKNVSVHEQKIILMNSSKPYEVLNYLDELDLKASRLLLEELNFDEIKHIISLFSSEDKKKFYATFSNLSLVNQFIVQDKNSSKHIENLSFERKVDLIDSSDKQTQAATSVIYESMPYEERISAAEKVTDVDAAYTLESTDVYNDTVEQEMLNSVEQQEAQEETQETKQEEQQEKLSEEKPEEKLPEEKKEESKEKPQKQEKELEEEKTNEDKKELQDEELSNESLDLSIESGQSSNEHETNVLEEFQQERNRCEQQEILNLINQNQQIIPDETVKTM